MDWGPSWQALHNNWGNIASVAGLVVSAFTLWFAKKARIAAEDAKAAARRQSLIDELQDAQKKAEDLGAYLHQQKWEIVHLRSQEVITSCSQILLRWGAESLSTASHKNLLRAGQQSGSIAQIAIRALRTPPSNREFEDMCLAQQKALKLLSFEAASFAGIIEKAR